jgi:hypothetical protein
MKIFKLFTVCFLLIALLQTCKEEEVHQPVDTDNNIPLAITDVIVENLPGAAKITYNIPKDRDFLYVKAVCEIKPGEFREVKASFYTSSLIMDGFGDTREYEVKLYSIGRNEKSSEPVIIKVNPLLPPILEVYNTLDVREDWGGITFSFVNENEANVIFEVLTTDSLGSWIPVEAFYTKMQSAEFSVRGFEPETRIFGITIKDRWNNRSDTLTGEYTPWYELLLDKTKFKKVTLPTDYNEGYRANLQLEEIWDDEMDGCGNDYVSTPGYGQPQWFTFDMGVTAKLSRIRVHNRTCSEYLYNSGAVKKWELWGTTDPNPDGSWDSWTLLRECRSVKPSGLPAGQHTNEDLEYALRGEEFSFPPDIPNVRYIRWKNLENWGGVTHTNIHEIYVYGQPVE